MANNLPKTAHVKMIDIWMIVTMVIPFMEIITVAVKEVLKRKSLRGWVSFIIFPISSSDLHVVPADSEELATKVNKIRFLNCST